MSDDQRTASRKSEHVKIVLGEDVAAKGVYAGFAAYRLPHEALPELDLAEVDTTTTFLGKPMRAPLLVSSMTGGARDVARINMALAEATETLGLAMGVGSPIWLASASKRRMSFCGIRLRVCGTCPDSAIAWP